MRDISDFTDEHGFIGHKEWSDELQEYVLTDFGDSAQRTFSEYIFVSNNITFLREFHNRILVLISTSSGEYLRHWDPKEWTGRPGSMSRDNFTPILLTMFLYSLDEWMWKTIKTLFKRGGFLWNRVDISGKKKPWYIPPDWIGFANIGVILRWLAKNGDTTGRVISFPFIMCCDLFILAQSVIQVFLSHFVEKPGKWFTSNDLNLSLHYVAITPKWPTLFTWLGLRIYRHRKAAGDDNKRYKTRYTILSAWRSYFRNEKKHPPMHIVGEKALKELQGL